jgi:hypothetical protein
MSDLEHELIVEFGDAQHEADEMCQLARRALVAASSAQEAAFGRHDPWIDDALRRTSTATRGRRGQRQRPSLRPLGVRRPNF